MPDFKALIERLKVNEGFRSRVYKCSLGFDTIGYGFAIKDLELTEKEAEYLLANTELELWGCGLSPVPRAGCAEQVHYRSLDLCNSAKVAELISEVRPERIYHLAGLPAVPASWDDPWGTLEGNVRPLLNTLEAVRQLDLACRIMVVIC